LTILTLLALSDAFSCFIYTSSIFTSSTSSFSSSYGPVDLNYLPWVARFLSEFPGFTLFLLFFAFSFLGRFFFSGFGPKS
jgi:hypothetical protein